MSKKAKQASGKVAFTKEEIARAWKTNREVLRKEMDVVYKRAEKAALGQLNADYKAAEARGEEFHPSDQEIQDYVFTEMRREGLEPILALSVAAK